MFIAVRTGLEPATPCVTGMYSNQLNYRTIDSCLFQLASAKIEHNFEFAKFFRIFFAGEGEKMRKNVVFGLCLFPFLSGCGRFLRLTDAAGHPCPLLI